MGNSGFVTDSDTERELRKWQQARDMPIDVEKIRQQYKNRQNNAQGQHFEREILAGCRMYEQKGIATIDKTPEPFRVTSKNHRTGEFCRRGLKSWRIGRSDSRNRYYANNYCFCICPMGPRIKQDGR